MSMSPVELRRATVLSSFAGQIETSSEYMRFYLDKKL